MKKIVLILLIIIGATACTNVEKENNNNNVNGFSPVVIEQPEVEFTGEKGKLLNFDGDDIVIPVAEVSDGQAKFYNVKINEETIYFFVVKDNAGAYRAAANACQVCSDSKMGFYQDENFMVCNTCGNRYPLEKIATEKGGCNPVPINPNLEVKNNKIIINKSELEGLGKYF